MVRRALHGIDCNGWWPETAITPIASQWLECSGSQASVDGPETTRGVYCSTKSRSGKAVLPDLVPHIQEVGITGSGDLAATFVNGAIERGPYIFLALL